MKQAIVVQKYGGSSLSNEAALKDVAQQVVARARSGVGVVVVVSAMGQTTQALMKQAAKISAHPPPRELDMLLTAGERISMALLAMAVSELGQAVISLTGSQSGIITDERHSDARIVEVRPGRVLEGLARGQVVIVAGYQGVSRTREVTTLGRGGSDTSAVALGAALGAESVEILSDVEGVFTADPRLCPQAQALAHIEFAPMRRLGALGARVLKAEAVAYAARANIALIAAHNTQRGNQTIIGPQQGQQDPLALRDAATSFVSGPQLCACVERVAWADGAGLASPAARSALIAQATGLTGRTLLVLDSGIAVDWTYALAAAHERLVDELEQSDISVRRASCVSLVGDMLLDTTLAAAQSVLASHKIETWAQAHLPTSLSFVVPHEVRVQAAQLLLTLIEPHAATQVPRKG